MRHDSLFQNKKNQTQQTAGKYADILQESDPELISQLGSLVNLAIALDRSQTQPVQELTAKVKNDILRLQLKCEGEASVELREAEAVSKDFEKKSGGCRSFSPLWFP